MPVNIYSTTDSKEAVTAASGDVKPKSETVETKPATEGEKPPVETAAASEATDANAKEGEKPTEKPKKKGGFKKRIDKLNARVSVIEQEKEYWREQALAARKPDDKKTEAAPAKDPNAKPKTDDFEKHEDYVEALTDWKVDQKLKAKESESKANEAKADDQKKSMTFTEKAKAFAKEHTDYDEVLEAVNDIPLSITMQQLLKASENGPELAYEMAKNRDEFAKICKLGPLEAARELGKFEAKLAKAAAAAKEPATEVKPKPAPPSTVGAKGGSVKKDINDPNLPYREWLVMREDELKAAKSARR